MARSQMSNGNKPLNLLNQTNWYVITGAPCSGKTSVINGLARRGYKVLPEAARAYIDSQLALGLTLEEIKADILPFERHILLDKARIEERLDERRLVFLDRAVPDSIAYFQFEGLDCREPLAYSRRRRYQKIFLFEQLEFKKDAVRSEDRTIAWRIETLLEKCYLDLGYPIIRVPVLPVDQRIAFVLGQVDTQDVIAP